MKNLDGSIRDGNMKTSGDQLSQLKAEIQLLRQENQQLRSDNAAALFKMEEQVAIEKRYQESQSRFETIFQKSKIGNKIIAPDLRIIQINEVFQQMLGYSEAEIVGTKIIAFAHPDFVQHWHELQENLWTRQIPSFQIETCLVKKDGSAFWCQVTSILFRDQQSTLGYTIVEDISKRKALEKDMKKLYDNQEAMMHMVVHDLKSPLYNIQLLSEFLKENLEKLPAAAPEVKADHLKLIQMVSDTCKEASIIIKDLLLLGELETNENPEETNLVTFIQAQLKLLEVEAKKKGINVVFDYPAEPVWAFIVPEKFMRVLINLLSNAVKFTHASGQVTISLQQQAERVLLQVSDTGIGIPNHLQNCLFDKFTKAKRYGTAGETTTGLGLYIVKQIVESHKGKIWVESKENEGTSFFIQLN